jgi:hypothetical protein
MKSAHPVLFIRKLLMHDYLSRVYQKSVDLFPRDGTEHRFRVVFAKQSDID